MAQIILDTSVILKLFLDEEWSYIAVKIKDEHIKGRVDITVPSLAKYELINVLKYKNFSNHEVKEALEAVRDYAFSVIEPNDFLINEIADYSVEYDISAYDATYVALAHHMDRTMYTADQKLIKAVKLPFVKHIKEFK